jgi:hypothetical protein
MEVVPASKGLIGTVIQQQMIAHIIALIVRVVLLVQMTALLKEYLHAVVMVLFGLAAITTAMFAWNGLILSHVKLRMVVDTGDVVRIKKPVDGIVIIVQIVVSLAVVIMIQIVVKMNVLL